MKKIVKIDKNYEFTKKADSILISININEISTTAKEALNKYEKKLNEIKDILKKYGLKSVCMSFIKYRRILNNTEEWICAGKHEIKTDKLINELYSIDNIELTIKYIVHNYTESFEYYKELIKTDISNEKAKINAKKVKLISLYHSAHKIIDDSSENIKLSTHIVAELCFKI